MGGFKCRKKSTKWGKDKYEDHSYQWVLYPAPQRGEEMRGKRSLLSRAPENLG